MGETSWQRFRKNFNPAETVCSNNAAPPPPPGLVLCLGSRVWGFGCRGLGLEFGVWGLVFLSGVWSLGLRVED